MISFPSFIFYHILNVYSSYLSVFSTMILSGNVQNHVFHSNSGYSSIGCAPSRISRPSREVRPSCGRRCTYRQRPSGCGVPTCRPLLRACCCSRHKLQPALAAEIHRFVQKFTLPHTPQYQQVPLRLQFLSVVIAKGISLPICGYLCSTIVPSKSTAIIIFSGCSGRPVRNGCQTGGKCIWGFIGLSGYIRD